MLAFGLRLAQAAAEVETETNVDVVEQAVEETKEQVNYLVKSWNVIWPYLQKFAINLIGAVIIFIIGKILIKLIVKVLSKFFDRSKLDVGANKFLLSVVRFALNAILICLVLGKLGVEGSTFIAILGSAGLALGLALQGSLSNFAGGVLLMIFKPFRVGDYIVENGKEGTVSKIDLFYTHLVTVDNKSLVIPNGGIANSSLINLTAFEKRRLDFQIGIAYSADIAKAKKVLVEVSKKHPKVLQNEEIFPFVESLDDSQVTLGLRVWVKTSDYWTTRFDLLEEIKMELDAAGVEIPFPQLAVHVKEKATLNK